MNNFEIDSASFRDSNGVVFYSENNVYRSISPKGIDDFEAAEKAGVHNELIERNLLISHTKVSKTSHTPPDTALILQHPTVPMISYPWEWPFSLLKDSALLHLDLMEFLIPKGFWLRDANAFNAQYINGKPVLIDTLSIGKRPENSPWVAYLQFCMHFLAPLALQSHVGSNAIHLWRGYPNGFPLQMISKLLPLHKKLSTGILLHLVLHAKFLHSNHTTSSQNSTTKTTLSDAKLLVLIKSLKKAINKLDHPKNENVWKNYVNTRTYEKTDVSTKLSFVEKILKDLSPKIVWDLGGNTGEVSDLSSKIADSTISIDSDSTCSEFVYQKIKNNKLSHSILPLTIDLSNPSPGLGWATSERKSIYERCDADLIFALALIHHLVFSANVPLQKVAHMMSDMSANLVIEFVPYEDVMVKQLLKARNGNHLPYTIELFELSFSTYFTLQSKKKLENGRILYFYQR